eukprot:247710_1
MTESIQQEKKNLETEEIASSIQLPNWEKRKFPKSPGFVNLSVDSVITNVIQLLLVFTNIIVIFSSTTIDYDKDTLGWIIFLMFVFTWLGFGLYIREIRKHAIIYRTHFKCVDKCYYKENERLSNNSHTTCFCLRFIGIRIFWWLHALLRFPFIILWSVWKSFQNYKNQNKKNITTDITQIDWNSNHNLDKNKQEQYMKIAETAYGVSHLGLLAKQASMIVCFIQDIPLLVLCAIIGNEFGLVVYSIIIIIKIAFWIKYMIDVGGFRYFYKYEDYLLSFGLMSVEWEIDTFGCCYAIPVFLLDDEKQKALWQIRDYVKCLKSKECEEWVIMMILAINQKKNEIVVVDTSFDKDFLSTQELMKMIEDKGAYTFDRWDEGIQPLNNEELIEFIQNRNINNSENTGNVSSQSDKITSSEHEKQTNEEVLQVVVKQGNDQNDTNESNE